MIESLELQNWKAYSRLHQEFHAGTTFIVAKNGVGKSSIVQAIYFALFGGASLLGRKSSPVGNAIRGGEGTETYVQLRLSLGDSRVVVRRTMTKAKRITVQTAVQIDGELTSESKFRALLQRYAGVDPTQLALMSVVGEGQVLSSEDAGIDIAGMLAETFGVDRLRAAAAHSKSRAARLDRDADQLRRSLRDVADARHEDERIDLLARRRRHEERRDALRSSVSSLRRQLAEAQAWQAFDAAVQIYERKAAAASNERERRLRDLRDELIEAGLLRPQDAVISDHEAMDSLVSERLDALHSDRGGSEARLAAADTALQDLEAGRGVCPTCHRPLSTTELVEAISQNERIRTREQRAIARGDRSLEVLSRVRRELQTMRGSGPRHPAAPEGNRSAPGALNPDMLASLERELEAETQLVSDVSAELRTLEQEQQARRENTALSSRIVSMYGRAEFAFALSDALSRSADAITAQRISPLTKEVEKRWASLWRREPLSMDDHGALSLSHNDQVVPFSEFSGGQRTVAQILVRILALQMATRSPFLILDEPLEHLDPRNRRLLASLLVNASEGETPLKQVLVTTYEESVTRRLSNWDGDPTDDGTFKSHVVQVRSSVDPNAGSLAR